MREFLQLAKKRVRLPEIYCVVVYNGAESLPETTTYKLSDAFKHNRGSIDEEIVVHACNINYDANNMPLILECNPDLKEFSKFIHLIRTYNAMGMQLEESVKHVVNEMKSSRLWGRF